MISLNDGEKSTTDWYLFEATDDSSFTMRFIDAESGGAGECMHSLRGAFSETDYIYGFGARETLRLGFRSNFISVGLGLGYCETLLAGLMLQHNVADFYLESFESDERLREQFHDWIFDKKILPDFAEVYDQSLRSTSALCAVSADLLKESLCRVVFRESLLPDTIFTQKFSCVFFDAFSSKSSPELWSEEFLARFFKDACADDCVFVTYACTGALKRALTAAGFRVQIRAGFSSKRDSTFAVRTSEKDNGK